MVIEQSLLVAQAYEQRVNVGFEYSVHFTRDVFDPGNITFVKAVSRREPERRHKLFVVVDGGVAAAWPQLSARIAAYCARHADHLALLAEPLVIPGGEDAKNSPELVERIQSEMRRLGVDRQSFCVGIGGGAVLDAVGYAAATTHRGVRLVRLPTTVLGQNDSGVGVKNGINAFGAKNFLGTFAPPFAVVNDAAFLETLPARDKRSGMAEAVKVALIRDASFFGWLEQNADALARFDADAMMPMIRRGAEIHMRHIATAGDPFECGSARPLDFGHWSAHRLESLSEHAVRHGEAVAIGMALDCRYAHTAGMLSANDLERIVRLLEQLGFRLYHPALAASVDEGRPALLQGLAEFREHLGGELTVTLLRGVGDAVEVHEIDEQLVLSALEWLRERDARPRATVLRHGGPQ
jgi:3-dehydroquinate synthase